MLTIRVSSATTSLIWSITSGKKMGFTARNRMSACAATILLSVVVLILNFVLTFSTVVSVLAEPMMSSGAAIPFCNIPPIMAVAIFPSPINPIFMISFLLFCLSSIIMVSGAFDPDIIIIQSHVNIIGCASNAWHLIISIKQMGPG